MNWISNEELERKLKQLLELIRSEISKGGGIDTGAGGRPEGGAITGGSQTGAGGTTEETSEEKEWRTFFEKKLINNDQEKSRWKKESGLTPQEAYIVYDDKGWEKLSPPEITNLGKKKADYTDKDKYHTTNVELTKHELSRIFGVHTIIKVFKEAENLADISNWTDEKIKDEYKESEVPRSLNYAKVIAIAEEKRKELFKKAFEETAGTNHGLSNKKIDDWRKEETGLAKNGTEEAMAFKNGWTEPGDIKQGEIDYREIEHIDVLEIKKSDIDNEIKKADTILAEISAANHFYELPEGRWEARIRDLKEKLLPTSKHRNAIRTIRNNRIINFTYSLIDERDGGISEEAWKKAVAKLENYWKAATKSQLTVKILNEFLKDNEVELGNGIFEDLDKSDEQGKTWLVKQDAYDTSRETAEQTKIIWKEKTLEFKDTSGEDRKFEKDQKLSGQDILDIEEYWDLVAKGGLLLEYFYEKNGFNIDGLKFCTADKPDQGRWAIGTGVGKTTKLMNCLVRGGEKNVVLVCPTPALASSAYGHHIDWLQKWGCVYHKNNPQEVEEEVVIENEKTGEKSKVKRKVIRYESHGQYKVALNDLVTDDKGNLINGLSILTPGYLLGFLTRKLFTTSQKGPSDTAARIGVNMLKKTDFSDDIRNEIKTRKILDNTIIVFDEAHYTGVSSYQTFQDQITKLSTILKVPVIIMSATFEGVPFSITSTYPIRTLHMDRILPQYRDEIKQKTVDLDKQLQTGKTLVFMKNMGHKDYNYKPKDENDRPPFIPLNTKVLEDNNIPFVILTKEYEAYAESISYGMPPGSLLIGDNTYEMGFTFDIDTAIITGWMEMSSLSKNWTYTKPQQMRLSLASFVQQRGRVGRKKEGTVITLSKELAPPKETKDIAIAVVKACFGADGEAAWRRSLDQVGFAKPNEMHVLRGAVCLPGDSDKKQGKFGLYPEVLAVGVHGSPIGNEISPKFDRKYQSIFPDPDLYAKHKLTYEEPQLEKTTGLELLKLMVGSQIKKQKEFPDKMELEMKGKLIGYTEIKNSEVQEVLHTVIRRELFEKDPELKNNPNKTKFSERQLSTFREVVKLYRLIYGTELKRNIDVVEEYIDKKKPEKGKQKILKINYPEAIEV